MIHLRPFFYHTQTFFIFMHCKIDLHNADKNSGKLGHGEKKDTFGVTATLNKLSLEGEEDWMSHAAATITLLHGLFLSFYFSWQ